MDIAESVGLESILPLVSIVIAAVAAITTAGMAVETRRLGNAATKTLALQIAPMLGVRDVRVEFGVSSPTTVVLRENNSSSQLSSSSVRRQMAFTLVGSMSMRLEVTRIGAPSDRMKQRQMMQEGVMSPQAATAKQDVGRLLEHLPDDSTLEDIQYHLYVLEKIRRGQADVAAGRQYSGEQARQRLQQWLLQD